MDPSFIFSIANLIQQNSLSKNAGLAAAYEHEELKRQAQILQTRKEIRKEVNEKSNTIIRLSSEYPKQVFVLLHLYGFELESNGVIPDNFVDIGEKEKTALLWKKLVNLHKKCLPLLTSQMREDCDQCLEAINKKQLIELASTRIEDYKNFENQKPKADRFSKINKGLHICVWAYPFLIIGLTALSVKYSSFFSWKVSWSTLPDFIILIGIFSEVILLGVYAIFSNVYFHNAKIDLEKYCVASDANALEFWKTVKEKFEGLPTMDQLQSIWNENDEIVKEFFKDLPPLNNQEEYKTE
jgi:hypothetical protein